MQGKDDLHNRVVKLEVGQKELLDKKEEAFFYHTKNQMDIQDIKDNIVHMNNSIDKIVVAIAGDDKLGHLGFVKKMDDQDRRIIELEKFQAKFMITIGTISAIFGVAGAGVALGIEHLIKWLA